MPQLTTTKLKKVWRVYVQSTIPDARASIRQKQFAALGLNNKIGAVRLADCYTIDSKLDSKQLEKSKNLLANPLMQRADTKLAAPSNFAYAIEFGFLPGVTDNISHTAKETLSDGAKIKFKPGENIYSSQVLFISGQLSSGDAKKIANSLYNPLIQQAVIKSFADFKREGGINLPIPQVKLKAGSKVMKVGLDVNDEELTRLGKLGIINPGGAHQGPLALSLDELKAIRDYFKKQNRKPTDVELEALAQTWSEH